MATTHDPRCLCYTCEQLPRKRDHIARCQLRDMTAQGTLTGIARHWMEVARGEWPTDMPVAPLDVQR